MSDFTDKFGLLLSREVPAARRDPERMGDLIGALVDGLALTVAMATIGNGASPDELLEGISVQLVEGVAEKAPLARFVGQAAR